MLGLVYTCSSTYATRAIATGIYTHTFEGHFFQNDLMYVYNKIRPLILWKTPHSTKTHMNTVSHIAIMLIYLSQKLMPELIHGHFLQPYLV